MGGENEFGKCQVCQKEGIVERTYFRYDIECECHSPKHFEIVFHCSNCIPKEPIVTSVLIKTEKLKLIMDNKLKEAVQTLCEELRKDKSEGSYYCSWQANIAMCIINQLVEDKLILPGSRLYSYLLESVNAGSKRFLDLLISQPEKQ